MFSLAITIFFVHVYYFKLMHKIYQSSRICHAYNTFIACTSVCCIYVVHFCSTKYITLVELSYVLACNFHFIIRT